MVNKIIINYKIVEIITEEIYLGIQIKYKGDLFIKNLLPDDYIVAKGNQKIIIVRFNKRHEILDELFEYTGYCDISSAHMIVREEGQLIKKKIFITRSVRSCWNKFGEITNLKGITQKPTWLSMTTNYEDMVNEERNDYRKSFKITRKKDKTTKKITYQRQTIRTTSNAFKKDRNLSTTKKLQDAIGETENLSKNAQKQIRSKY